MGTYLGDPGHVNMLHINTTFPRLSSPYSSNENKVGSTTTDRYCAYL